MESGRSNSRKRKLAAFEAPAAAEAPNRGAGMEHQEPPLPGEDGEHGGTGDNISQTPDAVGCPVPPLPGADGGGSDHISHLPDDVLRVIISLLYTREGARTQILASRWRNLWRSAPLNLDHHWLCKDGEDLDAVLSRVLSDHPGPGRRFCAPVYHLHGDRAATADAWLRSPALDNLQELELCCFSDRLPYPPQVPLPPPAAAFRFSETLCVAIIGDCHLPDSTVQTLHFPKLKQLGLKRVSISECSMHSMIAGCPALECLLIEQSFGFHRLRINSVTLKGIGLCASLERKGIHFGELIIENAPCLERLLQLGTTMGQRISVISAPKLETIGCLCGINFLPTRLVFGSTVIEGLRVDTLTTSVHTVKILALDIHTLSLNVVIILMRCFPCLEKLYIESRGPGETNLWRRKHLDVIRSLDIRLKTICWRYYRGIKSHVDFATFFVLNAKGLKLMTLEVHEDDYNEEFIAQQRNKLQLDSKASGSARFCFTPDWSHSCARYFRVHDLALADPFERNKPYQFSALA
ncbi:unnamed protein product [Alopecurus aequalis]